MSALARLAIITINPPSPQMSKTHGEPMTEMERTALEVARRAAPPQPAPVVSFAPEPRTPAGMTGSWLARIRAAASL